MTCSCETWDGTADCGCACCVNMSDIEAERDAAARGMREALGIIEKAGQVLDVDWEKLGRDDLLTLMSRTLTFLHNGPEMVRACVIGSIPREP